MLTRKYDLLQVAAYDNTQRKMAFFDPSRAQDFLFISGTKVCISSSLVKITSAANKSRRKYSI